MPEIMQPHHGPGAHVVVATRGSRCTKAHEAEQRREILAPYLVTPALMKRARPDAIFLHDLPAYRGDEVVPEAIDGPQSMIYPEAVSQLHVVRALLLFFLHPDWAGIAAAAGASVGAFDSRLEDLAGRSTVRSRA